MARIAVVGLGAMGSRMALRLLDSGDAVTAWNRSPGKAAELLRRGATEARTPAEAAASADWVLTMLGSDAALREVTIGAHGIRDSLPANAVHVSCSTVSLALARELAEAHAERGQSMLTATVLGRPPAIDAGKLFLIAAGEPALIERFRPVADALGQRLYVVGDTPWHANLVKLCANFMIFSTIEQLSEVFAVCSKAGIPEQTVFEVLSTSFFNAPVHLNYGKLIIDRAFDTPGAPMPIGVKDTGLMLGASDDLAAPMPIASLLRDRFLASLAKGESELDFTALSKRAREDAGLT